MFACWHAHFAIVTSVKVVPDEYASSTKALSDPDVDICGMSGHVLRYRAPLQPKIRVRMYNVSDM
jgi:hypothetical protein